MSEIEVHNKYRVVDNFKRTTLINVYYFLKMSYLSHVRFPFQLLIYKLIYKQAKSYFQMTITYCIACRTQMITSNGQ